MFAPTGINEKLNKICDEALVREREKQPARNYLGASRLGEDCARKLFYEYTKAPSQGFNGKTYRIFDFGHDAEERVAANLRYAGFELKTHKDDGSQFGFGTAWKDGIARISGHIDGVLLGGPIDLPYPLLWENKALGNKSWNKTVTEGVKKSKPVYYAQMQIYNAYLELPNGSLFTAINRDSGELFFELVPFDPEAAQKASDRGVKVISATQASDLPRVAKDSTDFRCRFCSYSELCWKENIVQTPAFAPSWLAK